MVNFEVESKNIVVLDTSNIKTLRNWAKMLSYEAESWLNQLSVLQQILNNCHSSRKAQKLLRDWRYNVDKSKAARSLHAELRAYDYTDDAPSVCKSETLEECVLNVVKEYEEEKYHGKY